MSILATAPSLTPANCSRSWLSWLQCSASELVLRGAVVGVLASGTVGGVDVGGGSGAGVVVGAVDMIEGGAVVVVVVVVVVATAATGVAAVAEPAQTRWP